MIAPSPGILRLARCETCHGRFLPLEGPCPRCGGRSITSYEVTGEGKVLAATSLAAPAEGWTAPHPLVLVEVPDGVRLLAIGDVELPEVGADVDVLTVGTTYRARRRSLPAR